MAVWHSLPPRHWLPRHWLPKHWLPKHWLPKHWLLGALVFLAACDDEVTVGPGAGGAGGGGAPPNTSSGGMDNPLQDPQLGDPKIVSAQRIDFGPGGVLLIGDGRTDRLVAIETGDTDESTRKANTFQRVDNVTVKAARAIGGNVTASELQVDDIAVNPISWRTYVTVSRFTTYEAFVLWADEDGNLHNFDLANVVHAYVEVPPKSSPTSFIADVSWTADFVVGAVNPENFTESTLAFVPTPFEHQGHPIYSSTRVYSRTLGAWITEQPLDHFFTFIPEATTGPAPGTGPSGDSPVLVASYGPTVARFDASDLAEGQDHVNGTTVFDIGDGRAVLDFFTYRQGDTWYAVASIFNLLFDNTPAAAKMDAELFTQSVLVNEAAPFLFDFSGNPLVPGVERVYALDLATRMAPVGDSVVILRNNTLSVIPLP